jgi:hypothetical protein
MPVISDSVGAGGQNEPDDVREVRRLLNRHNLGSDGPVADSDEADPRLIAAIRRFQSVYVGLPSPDGRVDVGGRTLRRLQDGGAGRPLEPVRSTPETRADDRELRRKIVGPSVKETGTTTAILERLVPHLSKIRARVISGWLSDTDLFWKVNYHWAYLLDLVEHCLTLSLDVKVEGALRQIRSTLLANAPDPATGYLTSPLGKPEDRSSVAAFDTRHKILSQAKRDFKSLDQSSGLRDKSRRAPKAFDYAVAPVAAPASSKHSTGYALDIEGDNPRIKSLCSGLGATLVFDEKSHVHVEFKNGVSRA